VTEVRRISGSIVCIRRPSYQTCSYIVQMADGLVLLDAGMSSDGSDVQAGLTELSAKASDIRAILLTHWHNDHAAGAQAAREISGAPVYYHRADEAFFTGTSGAKGVRGWISDLIPEWGVLVLAKGLIGEATPRPIPAQHFVRDGDVVLDKFDVIETPGHTAGHVSYFYRSERVLFAGDALAVIDGQVRFMARPVTLDVESARRSMEKCLKLEPHILCPGHREPLVAAESACGVMLSHLQNGGNWPLLG
jgi:glyoxylase-like metal-dependent hydrolase (beta-lactamase superfamily II)